VVLVVLSLGDDDDDAATSDSTTTTVGEISDTGQDLLDLLELGRDKPMHVRFEAAPGDGAAEGSLVVELWRKDGRVRQDLRLSAGEGTLNTEVSAFELPDGNVICQRASEADWVCERAISTATENDEPAGLIEAAAANLGGADVTVTEETILDTPVRCFAISGAAGASTLCVTDAGVPLRIAVESQVLTATVAETEVADAVFTPPADVPDAPTTTEAEPA
jgi:hypothetical protein